MNDNHETWGSSASVVGSRRREANDRIASHESMWSIKKLTPNETQKTQLNQFSYSGMTIIRRDGSEK